ncbi:alkaline phosphatase [Natronococcus occultus]|uniref:Alkaline phosphatase n=1 Tax=Natronococcus occultus SP4 TaxID=694430 RepID=L0K3U7_9EURY|nr:alkaline phosphatase [Natronococcus occultus]AGB39696.1 Alkaline phosphatase [Natronococcus occultus SP4]
MSRNNCCTGSIAPDPDSLPPIATERRSFIKGVGALTGGAALSGRAAADDTDEESNADSAEECRNAIMFIHDGMGPTQVTGARYLKAYQEDAEQFPLNADPSETPLHMDRHEAHGTMTVFPDDPNEVVIDSAAGATSPGAIDCAASATGIGAGVKTYNGAIGGIRNEDGEFVPVETILEAASDAGLATGLVTTTRITHATPAAFAAHVPHRSMEDEIAEQYVENADVDVLLGGGKAHFDPDQREDGRDLLGAAEEQGYRIVETDEELADVDESPVLGLFTEDDSHLNYYLDRQSGTTQPGLVEMTEKALDLLSQNDEGFFIMVEAGRVDHCGHKNDPAILDEQLEGDRAVGTCLDFARDDATAPTSVVTTADHECGGFSLGRDGIYNVDYEMIDALEASVTEGIVPAIDDDVEDVTDLQEVMSEVAGIELEDVDRNHSEADIYRSIDLGPLYAEVPALRDMLNRQMLIDFTSHGHTGVDVPLYADGPNAEFFDRARDNTDIADVMADALGVK